MRAKYPQLKKKLSLKPKNYKQKNVLCMYMLNEYNILLFAYACSMLRRIYSDKYNTAHDKINK